MRFSAKQFCAFGCVEVKKLIGLNFVTKFLKVEAIFAQSLLDTHSRLKVLLIDCVLGKYLIYVILEHTNK